jgi:hypothetical protein
MQLIVAEPDAFDRFDGTAGDLRDRNQTTVHKLTINQHAARAALALTATLFSSGKAQLLAQHIKQALHRKSMQRPRLAIYGAVNFDLL